MFKGIYFKLVTTYLSLFMAIVLLVSFFISSVFYKQFTNQIQEELVNACVKTNVLMQRYYNNEITKEELTAWINAMAYISNLKIYILNPDASVLHKVSESEEMSMNIQIKQDKLEERVQNLENREQIVSEKEKQFDDIETDIKDKNNKIQELELIVENQENLIKYDEGIIKKLTEKIKSLHELTLKSKETFIDLGAKISTVGNRIFNLENKLENEEKKGIFSIIGQRIKSIFSKKALLPPASNECREIYQDSININGSADKCRFEMQRYDEKENVNEIREILEERKNLKKNINNVDITKNIKQEDIDNSNISKDSYERSLEK